jgi:hypothetical protein
MKIPFIKGKVEAADIFKGFRDGVDAMAFTKEEIAGLNVKLADKLADYAKDTLSENTERSKTRRFLAKFITFNFFGAFWLLVVLLLLGKNIDLILKLIGAFNLGTLMLMVGAFFFGGYYLKQYQKEKKNK